MGQCGPPSTSKWKIAACCLPNGSEMKDRSDRVTRAFSGLHHLWAKRWRRPKAINLSASFRGEGGFSASSTWQHIREYYKKKPALLALVIVLTFGSPFLGLVLAEWAGVIVGLVVSGITLYLGFRAVITVREIEKRS
jgi:hypothetical protein